MSRTIVSSSRASLFTKANVIAVFCILVVIVAAFVVLIGSMFSGVAEGSRLIAFVHDSEGKVYELPLDTDAVLEVNTARGSNTIVVQSGEVFVSEADCEGQDCVHQGKLSTTTAQIVCLPHRLWIEVQAQDESASDGSVLDVVSR